MYEFYIIRPNEDGTVNIGIDKDGNYVFISKKSSNYQHRLLIFTSFELAQEYVETFLNAKDYSVEWVLRTEKFICPICGSALKIQYAIDSDNTKSGWVERLGSCRNQECGLDFNILTDKDDNLIEINKHYFG